MRWLPTPDPECEEATIAVLDVNMEFLIFLRSHSANNQTTIVIETGIDIGNDTSPVKQFFEAARNQAKWH